MSFIKHLGRKSPVAMDDCMPLPNFGADFPLGELYGQPDHEIHHRLQHCLHKSYTGTDSCNATDRSGDHVYIAHHGGEMPELGPVYPELAHTTVVGELSGKHQTTGFWSPDTWENGRVELGSMDDINVDEFVSPLSELSSTNQTLTEFPLSVSSESLIAEIASESNKANGQSPNLMTGTPTNALDPGYDMSSQGCSHTRAEVDHAQTVTSQGSEISNSSPPFLWFDRNWAVHIITVTEAPIEILHKCVIALNQKWWKQLTQHLGPDVRLFLSTPFEKGIQTLHGYYRGTLPTTLEDTFALMHIVYACSAIYHKEEIPGFQQALFLDVLNWNHAIAIQEDRRLFIEVAFRLWFVPGCPIHDAATYFADLLSQLPLTRPETRSERECNSSVHLNATEGSELHDFHLSMSSSLADTIDGDLPDMLRLRGLLGEGQAISLCMHYLDGKPLLSIETFWLSLELKI